MRFACSPRVWLLVGVLTFQLGCGQKEEIHSSDVPKAKTSGAVVAEGPDKSRVLGAIIPTPDGQRFWFVKFRGAIGAVSAHENAFDEFVNSIRLEGNTLKWSAPAGWTENPPRAMRLVTFSPPNATPDSPELYLSEPFGGSLLENVNRWRKEVGAQEVAQAELPTVTTELMLGDVKAYKVDAKGAKDVSNSSMPPFMGR
jgi:hypothetical protein